MVSRRQVMGFRVRAQQLDRASGSLGDTAVLDIGVQETGPDGARWALAVRGVDVSAVSDDDVIMLWTVRGAPHLYRRADVAQIAAAVEPYSEADAAKRIFDASKPLRAAGIDTLAALDEVATRMRAIVTKPMVKGDVSGRLTAVMPKPYLRFCRPCNATHVYEQPFRLAAVRAGLELEPGTSPPVLRRIKGFRKGHRAEERFDLVRGCLRLLGPATPKQVAEFIDAPVTDVKERWPEDVVEVTVEGERRSLLAGDADELTAADAKGTRLLGPYDLFLQARDRSLLVPDPARAKELWPVLGRPGAVLVDGDLIGSWRPRQSGGKLAVAVQPWEKVAATTVKKVTEQAERLAAYRGVRLTGVDIAT
jgi:hypothetical protein